jgi:hypothetical protein
MLARFFLHGDGPKLFFLFFFGTVIFWKNAHLTKKKMYVLKMSQNMAAHKKMSLRKASEAKKYQVASDLLQFL